MELYFKKKSKTMFLNTKNNLEKTQQKYLKNVSAIKFSIFVSFYLSSVNKESLIKNLLDKLNFFASKKIKIFYLHVIQFISSFSYIFFISNDCTAACFIEQRNVNIVSSSVIGVFQSNFLLLSHYFILTCINFDF